MPSLANALLRLAAIAGMLAIGTPAFAQDKLLAFVTPNPSIDALWMADAHGLFKAEGLDVQIRPFPSGTTAFQTFSTGAGDIILSGDLPALQVWQRGGDYKVIAAVERDAKSYIVTANDSIKTPKDLIGKTVATRVGSTGSWFVSEFLAKNGIPESAVKVVNLDPPLMPPAICRGDIDAFFIWQPAPSQAEKICGDKVHQLSDAVGYVKGYNIAGARASLLATPKGADEVTRFLRALVKGQAIAAANVPEVTSYLEARFGMSAAEVKEQEDVMERVLKLDATFFGDFCSENCWQERAGLQKQPSDLAKWVWPDGLRAVDPARVSPAPPPC